MTNGILICLSYSWAHTSRHAQSLGRWYWHGPCWLWETGERKSSQRKLKIGIRRSLETRPWKIGRIEKTIGKEVRRGKIEKGVRGRKDEKGLGKERQGKKEVHDFAQWTRRKGCRCLSHSVQNAVEWRKDKQEVFKEWEDLGIVWLLGEFGRTAAVGGQ